MELRCNSNTIQYSLNVTINRYIRIRSLQNKHHNHTNWPNLAYQFVSVSLSLSLSFSYMFIFPEWFSPTRINKIKGNNVFVRLLLHILVPTCGTCCGMLNCMHECNRTKTLKVGLIYKTWKQGNCDIPVKTKYNEYTDKNSEMKIRSLVSSVCMLFLATMIRLMLSDGQKP